MTMVCGLDLHRRQITFDAGGGSGRGVARSGLAARPGAVPSVAAKRCDERGRWDRWRSRWRAAPVGGTSWRRSPRPGSRRMWPSRPIRRRRGAASGEPRPIGATVGCSASCWRMAGCRSRGFRRRWCSSGANGSGCTRRWSISARVGAADPCRALSARGVAAGDGDPFGGDPRAARRRRSRSARRPASGPDGVSDDRRQHDRLSPLKASCSASGSASPPAGRWSSSHYGIGGLLAVAMWSELGDCRRFTRSEQVVRHSGLDVTVDAVRSTTRRRVPLSPGAGDVALGALRSGEERLASPQPRPRLLRGGQGAAQRQDGRHLHRPPARPALLPHAARRRPRHRLRDALAAASRTAAGTAHLTSRVVSRPAPATGVPASIVLDGLQTPTRPRTHHRGGHPIRLLSPTTTTVEHPGNAGRPRTTTASAHTSMHRPSGWSRSYVLASLRALHLDQRLRPGAPRTKRALTLQLEQVTPGVRAA